nr:methyltransferase [Shimia ponticola]
MNAGVNLPKMAATDGASHAQSLGRFGWGLRGWVHRLAASPRFQSWAARTPGFARVARKEGEDLFDLISGFVQTQSLFALVELGILHQLSEGTRRVEVLRCDLPQDRLMILLKAGAAIGVLRLSGDSVGLTRKGAALLGVPGLVPMIRHHAVFYRDMADPVALLRGEAETELARFWPYVFGADGAVDPEVTQTYSDLMADSQAMVAEDTLRAVDLSDAREVLDIGGGTGAFLTAVGQRHADPALHLFDLPAVAPGAESRFRAANLSNRVTITPGSFRDDPLPQGADVITLIRVLYDHAEDTVVALLRAVHDALPDGGRLVVSEPMSGGKVPTRPGDVYFAFYTLAMQTGRARSAAEIAALMADAGFTNIKTPKPNRAFITSVVTGVRGN